MQFLTYINVICHAHGNPITAISIKGFKNAYEVNMRDWKSSGNSFRKKQNKTVI